LAFALAAAGSVTASLQALSSGSFIDAGSGEVLYSASQFATIVAAFGTLALVVAAFDVVAAAALDDVADVVCVVLELPPHPAIRALASSAAPIEVSLCPIARESVVGSVPRCR